MIDAENFEEEKAESEEIYEQLKKEEGEEENEIEDPAKYELSIYPSDIRLQDYKMDWGRERFEIPDFQRNYVWKPSQASRFIESFLLNLPVPPVFLYKDRGKGAYVIVDGQQRIISIVSFLSGQFVRGENEGETFALKVKREEWSGKTFKELDSSTRFDLESAVMRATIIEQLQPNDNSSIYAIFDRLNTGGTPLNNMEVRMCVGHGNFSELLKELNKLESWRTLLGKDADIRCGDLELILRFFALQEKWDEYNAPMKRFLNNYMNENKNMSQDCVDSKRKLFEETIDKALSINGEFIPFEKIKNISILISVLVALADSKISDVNSLRNFYNNLIVNKDYLGAVKIGRGTTATPIVKDGIKIAKEVLANG